MARLDGSTALVTAALVGVLLLTATAAPAVAATDTPVRLAGVDGPTAVGETATVPVVVEEADGGVGAYNLTVTVEDPDVATVVGAAVAGDPGLREVEVAPDGSGVTVRAALMDTADTGEVTIATVTVAGEAAGETDLTVAVETLGDEAGSPYAVTAEGGSSLAVEGNAGSADGAAGPSGDDSGSDDGNDASDDGDDVSGDGSGASGERSSASGDGSSAPDDGDDASDDGNGTESGSATDAESTGTTASGERSAGAASEPDDDEGRGFLSEVSGFSSYLAPTAAGFAIFAVAAMIGGIAYRRRLR
mgnify:CR=1 FL=1